MKTLPQIQQLNVYFNHYGVRNTGLHEYAYSIVATPHCLEHATTVNGKGQNISIEDMLAVAKSANVALKTARSIIEEVQEIILGFNALVMVSGMVTGMVVGMFYPRLLTTFHSRKRCDLP